MRSGASNGARTARRGTPGQSQAPRGVRRDHDSYADVDRRAPPSAHVAGPGETARSGAEAGEGFLRPKVPAVPLLVPCRTFAVAASLGGSRKETPMAARSNSPIVLGIDRGTLEGPALRWAAEQAHLEGRRLRLVTAAGPVSAVRRDHGVGSLTGEVGGTVHPGRRGPGQGSGGAPADRAIRRGRPDVPGSGSEHPAHPAGRLSSPRGSRLAGEGEPPRSRAGLRRSCACFEHASCPVVVHRPVYPGQSSPWHRRRGRGYGGLHARAGFRLPSSEPSASATQGRPLRVRRAIGSWSAFP